MPQLLWRSPFSIVTLTHNCISCNSTPLKCIYPLLSFPLSIPFQLYWHISFSSRVKRTVTKAAAKVLHYLCPQLSKALEHYQPCRTKFIICLALLLQHALYLFLNIKYSLTRLPFCLAAFWRILKDFFLSCSACSYLKVVIWIVRRISNVVSTSMLERI